MKVLYTAHCTATGGRDGNVESSDGVLNFKVATPKELGGPGGALTNPEQLFAAGYSACFDSAMRFVARSKKINVTETKVTAKVSIGALPAGGFGLSTEMDVHLPELDQAAAEELVKAAHQVCPYSNATRNNMNVTLTVHGK